MALKQIEESYDDQRGRRIDPSNQLFGKNNALGNRADNLKKIAGLIQSLSYMDMVALVTSLTVSMGTSISAEALIVWSEGVLERKS